MPEISNFINLLQFLLVKEDEHKFLLLKLYNDREETVTGVTLEITQKEPTGLPLQTFVVYCPIANGKPKSDFFIDQKIAMADACSDFTAKIISADFGNYRYSCEDGELVLSYLKNSAQNSGAATVQALMSGNRASGVSIRKYKIPVIISVIMLAVLAVSMVIMYFCLQNFIKTTDTFFYSEIEYAFEDGDKSENSNIYVVGCKSTLKDIVIPEKIKNHKVTRIENTAFSGNTNIRTLTIQAPIEIESLSFAMTTLSEVNLEKVTHIGQSAFWRCNSLKNFTACNLVEISEDAFFDCNNLENIKITNPRSVLKIKRNAFGQCNNLQKVIIDQYIDYSENYVFFSGAFHKFESLHLKNFNHNFQFNTTTYTDTDKTIPNLFGYESENGEYGRIFLKELIIENCDTISKNFCKNMLLTNVTIKNLKSSEVGESAFAGCFNLKKLEVPKKFISVGNLAFFDSGISKFDGSKLLSIGDEAFSHCSELTDFNLEKNDSLSYIGERAFINCVKLTNFKFPQSVTSIKNNTFENCTSLTDLTFSYNLQQIGDFAFAQCGQLTEISVPENVTSIGFGAFAYCTAVKEITLPFIGRSQTNSKFFASIFGGISYSSNAVPISIEKITISNAGEIPDGAFYNCNYVKEIIIESDFTRIGSAAFSGCKSLKEFVIAPSVSFIDNDAFTDCYKLFEVYNLSALNIIPSALNNGRAGYYALKVYSSLTEEPMAKINENGFEFGRDVGGNWFLINYTGNQNDLTLPLYPIYNGESINSYKIIKHMLPLNYYLKKLYIPSTVTEIGEHAFENSKALTSVYMPESVAAIGLGAFGGCVSLNEMVLPYIGNTLYNNRFCSYIFGASSFSDLSFVPENLHKVTILSGADIPDYAFYGYRNLKTVNLQNNYSSIGEAAFYECTALNDINFPSNLVSIGENAFFECESLKVVIIPESVNYIGLGAFSGCVGMQEITIPFIGASKTSNRYFNYIFGSESIYNTDKVPYLLKNVYLAKSTDIPNNAFYNCYYIENVVLPNELESIGENAFYNCNTLKSLELPPTVNTVNANAFYNCRQLKKVKLSSNIEIKENAFLDCILLNEIYNLGKMNLVQGSKENGYIAYYAFAIYNSLEEKPLERVKINDIVFDTWKDNWVISGYEGAAENLNLSSFEYAGKTISSYGIKYAAFSYNQFPVNLTVGKEVKFIEQNAFQGCYKLKTVTFENPVITELNDYVFSNCISLEKVVLPIGLQSIGSYAFSECLKLYSITIPLNVSEIKYSAFSNCYSLFDVYNLSSLNVQKGNSNNGGVALYALRVSTSAQVKPLVTVVSSNCRFMLFEEQWYLISVLQNQNDILSLPKSFIYNGKTIANYILLEGSLSGKYYKTIFIPQSVVKFHKSSSVYFSIDKIKYAGTAQQWSGLLNSIPNSSLKSVEVEYNSVGI